MVWHWSSIQFSLSVFIPCFMAQLLLCIWNCFEIVILFIFKALLLLQRLRISFVTQGFFFLLHLSTFWALESNTSLVFSPRVMCGEFTPTVALKTSATSRHLKQLFLFNQRMILNMQTSVRLSVCRSIGEFTNKVMTKGGVYVSSFLFSFLFSQESSIRVMVMLHRGRGVKVMGRG